MNLADQIAALQNSPVAELAARYIEVFGCAPRSRRNAAWLRKRVAHRLQENAYGGLPRVARAALDRLLAEIELPSTTSATAVTAKPSAPRVLVREWHGATYRVVTTTDGKYEWNGQRFGSLSAVAHAITGAHWSGALFFGLRGRTKA